MPKLIELPTRSDPRGNLSIIQDELGFFIQRVFYIYGVPTDSLRGGHGHKKTIMALVCLHGSIKINVVNSSKEESFILNSPSHCLLLNPEDWHEMTEFKNDAILLVLASEKYDPNDYVIKRPL